jgi:hypothetical protein
MRRSCRFRYGSWTVPFVPEVTDDERLGGAELWLGQEDE